MTQGSPAHRRVAHPPWKGHRPGLRGPRPVQAGTLETWFQECEGLSGWGRLGLRPDQALDGQSPLREGEIGAGAVATAESEPRAPRGVQNFISHIINHLQKEETGKCICQKGMY